MEVQLDKSQTRKKNKNLKETTWNDDLDIEGRETTAAAADYTTTQ